MHEEIDNYEALELNLAIVRTLNILKKAGFKPSQPRVPAGSADGGQWTDGDDARKKPTKVSYSASNDKLYQTGLYVFGYPAYSQLHLYSNFIQEQARDNQIDPNLIKGVILNESITRGGASIAEAIPSAILSDYGTYGPAQLGPEARALAEYC